LFADINDFYEINTFLCGALKKFVFVPYTLSLFVLKMMIPKLLQKADLSSKQYKSAMVGGQIH
jgi:hypothetical protein